MKQSHVDAHLYTNIHAFVTNAHGIGRGRCGRLNIIRICLHEIFIGMVTFDYDCCCAAGCLVIVVLMGYKLIKINFYICKYLCVIGDNAN